MKKFLMVTLFLMVFLPAGVLRAQTEESAPVKNTSNSVFSSIKNIQNIIKEKTPDILKKPFAYIYSKTEALRIDVVKIIEARKEKIKAVIGTEPTAEPEGGTDGMQRELLGAFKYFELFILVILIFALNVKLIFYAILAFLIFLIGHFFWYKIY